MLTPAKLALASILFSSQAAAQTTWFVDANAVAPFDGTAAQPYRQIRDAIAAASTLPGDTLLVAPGRYQSFSTAKRLTIRSTGGALVTGIEPATVNTLKTVRHVSFAYNSTLEGFTIWAAPAGMAVDSPGLTMNRCILLGGGAAYAGFHGDGGEANHCLITGFEFGLKADTNACGAYCELDARNSILHDNVLDFGPFTEGSYCVFESVAPMLSGALASIQAAPQCFDFLGHDFHLLPSSPCIDAGDPTSPLDPDGTRADIGPFPYDPNYQPYTSYCTAKVNSLGCTPSIAAQNTASLTSAQPFWISCTNQISQRSGLMSYGFAPLATPYQGGFKCVASPTRRSGLLNSGGNAATSDCSGVFTLDFNATIRAGLDPALTLGEEVYCQFWARDPAASFASNRSNALRFRVAP